jgi:translation initiation factor 1 (eIF-1/SUI1)
MPKQKVDVNEDLSVSIGEFFRVVKEPEHKEPAKDEGSKTSKKDSKLKISTHIDVKELIPQISKVSLQHQKAGRGGKTVTLIYIVEAKSEVMNNLEALLKELKKALGCGGQMEEGKIVLHGEIADRASEWFTKMGAKAVSYGKPKH